MNAIFKAAVPLMFFCAVGYAEYTETLSPDSPLINLKEECGLRDDQAASNQSAVFQRAIDRLAAEGGGRIVVPKGTYRLSSVRLRSNIHLLIDAGTVIRPDWPAGTKVVVFSLDAERPQNRKKWTEEDRRAYIENVSIRGVGGPFTIDYSDREYRKGEGSRGFLVKMAKNFLIENVDIRDNYTTYCGITLSPTDAKDISGWTVSRATDGTVRNCRIFHASPGYGLTQLHGAQSVHFENLYAEGGVTLRLETGAVGPQTGVFDISARNITNENGRCALMLGPHSARNGVVTADGVVAISSAYAVSVGKGGVKKAQLKINPDATDGIFAAGSCVRNITAVFGRTAQVKTHDILSIPEEYYPDLKLRWFNKFFEAPSIGGVKNETGGHYTVAIENVTLKGFKHNADKPILTEKDIRPGNKFEEIKKWKEKHGV